MFLTEKRLPQIVKDKQVHYHVAVDRSDKNGYPVSRQFYGYRSNPNLVLINLKSQVVLTTSDIEDAKVTLARLLSK